MDQDITAKWIVTLTRGLAESLAPRIAMGAVDLDAGVLRWADRTELFAPASGPTGIRARIVGAGVRAPLRARSRRTVDDSELLLLLGLDSDGTPTAVVHSSHGVVFDARVRIVGGSDLRDAALDMCVGASRPRIAAIAGCGRLGSTLAVLLPEIGIDEEFLIDGDVLEDHSLDAVESFVEDCGALKVDATARYLRVRHPKLMVHTEPSPVESDAAASACCRADVVVSAPDDNRARLSAALASTAALRIHLDVGAGVFDEDGRWTAGADIRLILPSQGCLLCAGGLDLARRDPRDWRRQRAGSLRSLNQIAATQAVALLRSHIEGELQRSTWLRLVMGRDGSIETELMPWRVDPRCPLCSRESGRGESALIGVPS